ncbi:hypothetical protein [Paenibacillus sp. LjRoot56]
MSKDGPSNNRTTNDSVYKPTLSSMKKEERSIDKPTISSITKKTTGK